MSPDPSTRPRSTTEQVTDRTIAETVAAAERDAAAARADEDQHQADRRRIGALFGRPPGTLRRLDHAARLLAERAPR